jgi:hypothetical protein
LRRAEVAPVAVVLVVGDPPAGQHPGQQPFAVITEITTLPLQLAQAFAQAVRPVGEDLGADVPAARLVRLVVDGADAAAVGLHHQVPRDIAAGRQFRGDHGGIGRRVKVRRDDLAMVDRQQVVGTADQQHVGVESRDHRPVLGQRIGVAVRETILVVPLEGRQGAEAATGAVQIPRPATGQVLVEQVRLVLLEHPDVDQTAVRRIGQREVDQPVVAAHRQCRLGPARCQRTETRSTATGKDDAQHSGDGHRTILPVARPGSRQCIAGQRGVSSASIGSPGRVGARTPGGRWPCRSWYAAR